MVLKTPQKILLKRNNNGRQTTTKKNKTIKIIKYA